MKMKLLAGVALALVLGVSSAAYANPKNSFSDNNTTTVTSVAAAINVGNISAGNGNNNGNGTGGDGGAGSDSDGGTGVGIGKGNGDSVQENGDQTAIAKSESYNVSVEGVSSQTLAGVSILNIQAAVAVNDNDGGDWAYNKNDAAAIAKIYNDGASANAHHTSGVTMASGAAGNGANSVQGSSIGAGANISF